MKSVMLKKLLFLCTILMFSLAISLSAMAATPSGSLEGADESSIYGWAWDSDSYGHIIPIEISIYPARSTEALKIDTIKADDYQEKLQQSIGDGYHGFTYSIDWTQFEQTDLRIIAYAVTDTERIFLGELTYNNETTNNVSSDNQTKTTSPSEAPSSKEISPSEVLSQEAFSTPGSDIDQEPEGSFVSFLEPGSIPASSQETISPGQESDTSQPYLQRLNINTSSQPEKKTTISNNTLASTERPLAPWEKGPGVIPAVTPVPEKEETPKKVSLGIFTTTGYCSCEECSTGSNLTYTETTPKAGHTIAADINIFPVGTKLMIGNTIYTVEDIGSNITQNKIDIFYATHEEAVQHGQKQEEIFVINE